MINKRESVRYNKIEVEEEISNTIVKYTAISPCTVALGVRLMIIV